MPLPPIGVPPPLGGPGLPEEVFAELEEPTEADLAGLCPDLLAGPPDGEDAWLGDLSLAELDALGEPGPIRPVWATPGLAPPAGDPAPMSRTMHTTPTMTEPLPALPARHHRRRGPRLLGNPGGFIRVTGQPEEKFILRK